MADTPPTPPTEPSTGAAIHASGITGVVSLLLLWGLNATVFRHNSPPADIAYAVAPAASYLVSLAAGYLTHWRLRHRQEAVTAPPTAPPVPESPPATPKP